MDQNERKIFSIFKTNKIFYSLTEEQKYELFLQSKIVTFRKDDYLVQENDISDSLYIIISGQVDILKYEPVYKKDLHLGRIESNGVFGEIGLLDKDKRTASVRAINTVIAIKIDYNFIMKFLQKHKESYGIFIKISNILAERIRTTNTSYIKLLEGQISQLMLTNRFGYFIINMICFFSLYIFLFPWLRSYTTNSINTTFISIGIDLIASIFVFF